MQDKKFYLSIHDFGFLLGGLDNILRIKKHYPDFKITCYTIPISKLFFTKENLQHFKIDKYKKWAEIINSYDWLEIGLHGFSHTYFEMDCQYDKAIELLQASENLWDKIGLKYKKLFVAPYWHYSYDALVALKDKGYVVSLDRNNPRSIPEGLKTFIYNWSVNEKLPKGKIIKGHGHAFKTEGVVNSIDECYENITKQISVNSQFGFVSEL